MTQRKTIRWVLVFGLALGLADLASSGVGASRAARHVAAGAAPSPGYRGAERPEPNPDEAGNPQLVVAGEVKEAAPAMAAPRGHLAPAARVVRLEIAYGEGGEAFVDVSMSGPAPYRVMSLKNPPRFAVDIEPARVETPRKLYPAQSPLLKDARVGQFDPSTVRVVADLSGQPIPDVYSEPGGLRIALRSAAGGSVSSEREVRSSGKPAVPVQSIPPQGNVPARPSSERRAPDRASSAAVLAAAKSSMAAPIESRRETRFSDSTMAGRRTAAVALADSADAPWLPRTRTMVSALPQNPASPAGEFPPAAAAAKVLAEAGGARAADTPTLAPGSPGKPPASGRPKYTGERISVNLKDVDLTDFFRLIHEVSGLNVIVDSNVSGKVTLVLDSVPWDQALDIVLENNGLGRVLEGNVLRIGRISTLEKEEGAAAQLEASKVEAGPLLTVIWPLKYARAVDTPAAQSTVPGLPTPVATPGVVSILKNLNGVLSSRGSVTADPRNNSLIITDVPSQIPVIESVIEKLDTKPKQISIEAKVVLANSDFVRDLTSALNGGTVNPSGSMVTGGATGTGASAQGNIPTPATAGGAPPPRVSLGQTVAAGFGAFAISSQSARYFINAAIAAAETRDQARTVSLPTIITLNNIAGKVAQGIEVPYQTTINNTISTQFKDATLELDVTPQVTDDGKVFLMLYVQDDTVGAVVPGLGTSINHQSATTQVLVPDGGTVVFGGIKVERRAKTATQIPGLGSVPLLGNLFKSSEVDRNDQELLFFVTPKVLPG